jgi:hypothetical protein
MYVPSQHAANLIYSIANWALFIGILFSAAGTFGSIWAGGIRERYADERISKNEADTAAANQRAAEANAQLALTNERVLAERRLTANERSRLSRLEKAVLPRALSPEMTVVLIDALKTGNFKTINVAYVDKPEPMLYAMSLMMAFKQAGIMGQFIRFPKNTNQAGVSIWKVNSDGERLAELLWQKFQIGGGVVAGAVPIGWETIPRDTNCLVIGENNAAMQPPDGHPGEGIDEHGVPIPAP